MRPAIRFNCSITRIIRGSGKTCDVVNTLSPPSLSPISVHNGTTRRSPNGIKTEGGVSRLNGGKHQFALTLARRVVVEIGNRIVRLVRNLHHPLRASTLPSCPSISSSTGRPTSIALFFNDKFFDVNWESELSLNENIQIKSKF